MSFRAKEPRSRPSRIGTRYGIHRRQRAAAGRADHPVWKTTRFDAILRSGQRYTPQQAVVRLAFELPRCARVAVGTDNPTHLRELIDAPRLAADREAVTRYRRLIDTSMPAPGPCQSTTSHPS